jgi:superfamily II DNA or RNA helicase
MFEYQVSHIAKIVNLFKTNQFVIDCSQTGSGKTYTSRDVARHIGIPLIICPKNILTYWDDIVFFKQLSNFELFKQDLVFKNIINKTDFAKKVKWNKPKLAIIDEIHLCKNDTKNRDILIKLLGLGIKVLGLTATITDKYLAYPDHKSVMMTYKSEFKNDIRWTSELEGDQVSFKLQDLQILERKKIPLYEKVFWEYKKSGLSVIMFCNFNNTIHRLHQKLGGLKVNGLQSFHTNEANMANFNSVGGLLLVNSQMGTSINLHDIVGDKPRGTIINIMWSGTLFKQVLGRAHRINSSSDTIQTILVTNNSLDKYIYSTLLKKLDVIDFQLGRETHIRGGENSVNEGSP